MLYQIVERAGTELAGSRVIRSSAGFKMTANIRDVEREILQLDDARAYWVVVFDRSDGSTQIVSASQFSDTVVTMLSIRAAVASLEPHSPQQWAIRELTGGDILDILRLALAGTRFHHTINDAGIAGSEADRISAILNRILEETKHA